MTCTLSSLLVMALLLVNSIAVWAAVTETLKIPAETSQHQPCHSKPADSANTGHACHKTCCDEANHCKAGCDKCPMLTLQAIFSDFEQAVTPVGSGLIELLADSPKQSDPLLFLQPPRQRA